jgi:hypothetical protein
MGPRDFDVVQGPLRDLLRPVKHFGHWRDSFVQTEEEPEGD